MTNPYQAPKSKLHKPEATEYPQNIKWAYRFLAAAFLAVSGQTMLVYYDLTEVLEFEFGADDTLWLLALKAFILGAGLFINAVIYYFLLYRPLKKRKTYTKNWFIILGGFFLLLSFDISSTFSWTGIDTLTSWLSIIEASLLLIAAWFLTRVDSKAWLINH